MLYVMDLSGFTIGHTDALEVIILRSIPDIQDTLLALNYKSVPASIDYYDVVADCSVDEMVKCLVGLCNPSKTNYYFLVQNQDGNRVSFLANVVIHKSSSISCSVMPLYWVAIVAIFVACSIVIAGVIVWFRRWCHRKKYVNVGQDQETASLTENKIQDLHIHK